MTDRRGGWIQTFTGRQYWAVDPRAEDVDIRDIAHALSLTCRYGGHCKEFYSVGEHSLHVSNLMPTTELAFIGLMHDGTEAYLTDIPRPFKSALPDYRKLEDRNWRAIAEKYRMPLEIPHEVKMVDTGMLFIERVRLLEDIPWLEWDAKANPHEDLTGRVDIWCMAPAVAERWFFSRFVELAHLTGRADLL